MKLNPITSIHLVPRSTSTTRRLRRGCQRGRYAGRTAIACVAVALACGSHNVRPYLVPLPDAVADTLHADPSEVIEFLNTVVAGEGFRISRASSAEGYLVTDWYDTENQRAGGRYARDPTAAIRLRFFADPGGGDQSTLRSEAVYRRTLDPSIPEREAERMVPPGHYGDLILQRVLQSVRSRFPELTP